LTRFISGVRAWLAWDAEDFWDRFLARSVIAVRWLLGVQCLLSGMNWWIKVLPFPNIADPPGMPVKTAIVGVMIESGWMFSLAKGVELMLAFALLFNRFVPAMLVISMPVILMTFLVDGMILGDVFAWLQGKITFAHVWARVLDAIFFGGAVLLMQAFLVFAYFDCYRTMLGQRALPKFPK
jgi:hypothetical protein